MLKIRRGRIRSITHKGVGVDGAEVELESGEVRPAISYRKLTGLVEEGDEVLVNIEALDLNLGSGGYDKLARHGVAALLNAESSEVVYTYSFEEIIAMIQSGLQADSSLGEPEASDLASANVLGCPIN